MSNAAAVLTNTSYPMQQQQQQQQPMNTQPVNTQQQGHAQGHAQGALGAEEHGLVSSNVSTKSYASNQRDDGTVVGLHYKIGKKIGEGSFGVLFEGVNLINGVQVAIKFEPRKSEAPQLRDEYKTYKILADSPGIPHAYYLGQQGLHNILVIDLLGPSLEDLFEWCGRRFSVKTVVQVAVQMISLLEQVHTHDLIYRDIKPDNFLIGRPNSMEANMVHLIDFGMAKQYRDPKTKKHIPYREKKSLSGTARYMSINTHLGREQSRRDDMESLGHVFFYFLRGQLPWQGLKAANNKQKYEKIGEKKRLTNVYDLAQGVPVQFGRYLDIVRNLDFEEVPDYEGYRQLLISALTEQNLTMDGEYDWMQLNGGKGWDLSINKKPNLHGYGRPNPPNEKSRRRNNNNNGNPANANNGTANNNNTTQTNTNVPVSQSFQQQQQQVQQVQQVPPPPQQQQQVPPPQQQQVPPQVQSPGQGYTAQGKMGSQEPLDPNSYEAYQKQTEQKYQKAQQQQLQQQQQQQQQNQGQGGQGGQGQGQRFYGNQPQLAGQQRYTNGGYGQNAQYRAASAPNYMADHAQGSAQGNAQGNKIFPSPQPAYGGYQAGGVKQGSGMPQHLGQLHHGQQQQQYHTGGEDDSAEHSKGFFAKLGCC